MYVLKQKLRVTKPHKVVVKRVLINGLSRESRKRGVKNSHFPLGLNGSVRQDVKV